MAERLLGVLGRPYDQAAGPVFLSVSIGVAGWAGEPDVVRLLRHADLALRYAKQRGKNRIERYDGRYDRLLRRRTTLEHELRGAIERDELRLAFQPVASLPSVRPVGAEALLRWHHPELGNVRPDEFIPLAEECGMIAKLGAWVLHQACYQLSRWLADGPRRLGLGQRLPARAARPGVRGPGRRGAARPPRAAAAAGAGGHRARRRHRPGRADPPARPRCG